MTINDTWAYNADDHERKSAKSLIRAQVEVASRGGNFGSTSARSPDGQVQPEFQERLRAIGEWLAVNGDSIYGTTYGPIEGLPALRTTAKANRIFIHVFDWSPAALELGDVRVKLLSARPLANGRPLKVAQTEGKLKIELSQQAPDPNVRTIALTTF
jgi:alpha-L-fucosidase